MVKLIKKGTSGLRQDAVSPHAGRIRNGIYGNPTTFPLPPLTEEEFQDLIDNYDVALIGAATRDKGKVKIKNEERKNLNAGIDLIFNFALNKVGSNPLNAAASGFPFTKVPAPVGNMPAPSGLTVVSPATSQGKVSFKKVPGAACYLLQYALVADEDWNSVIMTETRHILGSLNSLAMYKFRVAAVGADGQGPFCNVLNVPII
jgi:hypothetical protein